MRNLVIITGGSQGVGEELAKEFLKMFGYKEI